jgi:hypothetical protein
MLGGSALNSLVSKGSVTHIRNMVYLSNRGNVVTGIDWQDNKPGKINGFLYFIKCEKNGLRPHEHCPAQRLIDRLLDSWRKKKGKRLLA